MAIWVVVWLAIILIHGVWRATQDVEREQSKKREDWITKMLEMKREAQIVDINVHSAVSLYVMQHARINAKERTMQQMLIGIAEKLNRVGLVVFEERKEHGEDRLYLKASIRVLKQS